MPETPQFENDNENELEYEKEKNEPEQGDEWSKYSKNNKYDKSTFKIDRGYNSIRNKNVKINGKSVVEGITFYTSGDRGSQIRDAVTGTYYSQIVGSRGEDFFFKVKLATGECNGKNGSNTLFFVSQRDFEQTFGTILNNDVANKLREKHKSVKLRHQK